MKIFSTSTRYTYNTRHPLRFDLSSIEIIIDQRSSLTLALTTVDLANTKSQSELAMIGNHERAFFCYAICLLFLVLIPCSIGFTYSPASTKHSYVPSPLTWQQSSNKQRIYPSRTQCVGRLNHRQVTTQSLDDAATRRLSRNFFQVHPGCRRLSSLKSWRVEDNDGKSSDSTEDDDRDRAVSDRVRGWFRSSSSSTNNDDGGRPVKVKIEGLFSGMPSIDEMFGQDEDSDAANSAKETGRGEKRRKPVADWGWFEAERQSIIQSYDNILSEMLVKLDNQRKTEPDSVPENAEAMVKSILKQEMETEIEETRERMARDRFESYESEQRAEVETKDVSGDITDSRVRRLIDEGEAEYSRQLEAQVQLDEFLRYEEDAFRKATEEAEKNIVKPERNADLDKWALERIEEMASKQEALGADDAVLDILEETLEDLRDRMDKESTKMPQQPETMKEWQIYRAIATRLGATVEQDGSIVSGVDEDSDVTYGEVLRRLQAWKEYDEKEADIRQKGGLSRGPKLPFEWQELDAPSNEDTRFSVDGKQRVEARKQINRMSIDALESILERSDSSRREKLKNEIDFLRRELESRDFLDIEEPAERVSDPQGPVDLSDVFLSLEEETPPPASPLVDQSPARQTTPPPPVVQQVASVELSNPVPRPRTAFFADDEFEEKMEAADTDSKLGTMEDQKLEAMYRRAGARTRAEQERIRAGYEDFKRVEESKRNIAGLDEEDEDDLARSTLKYNVSDVLKEGGDFDAQKVLSAIGPRPTRTPKPNALEETRGGKEDSSLTSDVDEQEVVSSLYRSVSAAGGGRFKDDPEAKAEDKARFSEYIEMEKEMREQVESMSSDLLQSSSWQSDLDDENYVEKLSPRPKTQKAEQIDERYLSDTGAAIREELNDQEDKDDLQDDSERDRESSLSNRRTFLRGDEIEEAFSDDEYERNMRQLAEYERRRAGKPRQMGIDISDIFEPRRDISSDDYMDYKFEDRGRRYGWGGATYEVRKQELMEYTELEVPLLNALLEQKDAVSVTGVSPYMAKINKPFKAFGAIFRLEGVIVDISGLHSEAWTKTAEALELRTPSQDESKKASVLRPEIAVSDIFGWTTDLSEIEPITAHFREEFDISFQKFLEESGVSSPLESVASTLPSENVKGSLAIGEEFVEPKASDVETAVMTETEAIGLLTQAWTKAADTFSLPWPVNDDVVAAASMEPELAIMEVFRWTTDARKAEEIASFHRRAMKTLREGRNLSDMDFSQPGEDSAASSAQAKDIDKNTLMELHYRAWTTVASASGFDRPTTDEVLGAFVLNDPVLVVRNGFGWVEDLEEATKIGQAFTEKLRELVDKPAESVYGEMAQPEHISNHGTEDQPSDDNTLSFDDVVQVHETGWRVSCNIHGLVLPSPEQVRLSVNTDPREFVKRVMRWTDEPASVDRIVSTFQDASKDASSAFARLSTPEDSPAGKPESPSHRSGPSADEIFEAELEAWKAVAKKFGLSSPTSDQVMYALSVGPEGAIRYGFRWSTKEERVAELFAFFLQQIESRRKNWSNFGADRQTTDSSEDTQPPVQVNPGTDKWIQSLMDVEMECGIISHLSPSQVDTLLEYAGLSRLIGKDKRVCGSPRPQLKPIATHHVDSQQMLAASLRLERRPDHCVVVDGSPGSCVAARGVEMQSVAWIGSFPRYELLAADATVSRLEELTAMNIRRLFGERVYDQPLLDSQKTDIKKSRKIKTSFAWGDE